MATVFLGDENQMSNRRKFISSGLIVAGGTALLTIPGMGFANEMFGLHITPSLSTIDQQTVLMGREAIKLLLEICNRNDDSNEIKEKVVLEPLPFFRESSLRNK